MNKTSAITTVALVAAATLAAGAARADCPPTCLPLLCPRPTTTIVQGEVAADPGAVLGVSFIVGSVLKLAPGTTAPPPGRRLQPWSLTPATIGPAVGYYEGAALERPTGLFPIEDGKLHCRGAAASSSAPEGMGVTPEHLATLSPETCGPELAAAGYGNPPCDDVAFGCSTGGPPQRAPGWPIVTAALVALALASRARACEGTRLLQQQAPEHRSVL